MSKTRGSVEHNYQNYLSRMVNLVLNNVPIEFPFQPYDVQEKFMERVIECLQKVTSVALSVCGHLGLILLFLIK